MKNIKIQFGCLFLILMSLYSCDPRIDMDMEEWGDTAFINNVQLFKLETKDGIKLEEYYVDGTTVTGTRQVVVSTGTPIIDEATYTVTVKLKATESFTGIGVLIYHFGTKVEPINGAPVAGSINDLSAASFQYKVFSADGSEHDWTINIVK